MRPILRTEVDGTCGAPNVRGETRNEACSADTTALSTTWLDFRFALYPTGLIHGGIKVFHEPLGLGETREPKLLIEFVRV
jgi:hypothetical protein